MRRNTTQQQGYTTMARGQGGGGGRGQGRGRGGGRGQGRGQGGGRGQGKGRGVPGRTLKKCVCRACDISIPHEPGVPCLDVKCPQCGQPMMPE